MTELREFQNLLRCLRRSGLALIRSRLKLASMTQSQACLATTASISRPRAHCVHGCL
jgi:hypothetical protein